MVALADRYDGNTTVVRRVRSEQLVSRRRCPDEDSGEFLDAMDAVQDRLGEPGDPVSNAREEDILRLAHPPAYTFIVNSQANRDFGLADIRRFMRNTLSIVTLVLLLPLQCWGLVPLCRRWLGRSVGPAARLAIVPISTALPPTPRHQSTSANRNGRGALNRSLPRERASGAPITEQ